MNTEIDQIKQRYVKRVQLDGIYSFTKPDVYMAQQEKEREIIRWIIKSNIGSLENVRLLEIGCGGGKNLLSLLQWGFSAKNLVGNELLTDRVQSAKKLLPSDIQIIEGDAMLLDFKGDLFDVVYQSTVFTSILDDNFQKKLAEKMWSLLRPGGWILWYDFVYDNPTNKDVKGVPYKKIVALFPEGKITVRRLTLAPPISRIVTKIHPQVYTACNIFPFLRTHLLCGIQKPN